MRYIKKSQCYHIKNKWTLIILSLLLTQASFAQKKMEKQYVFFGHAYGDNSYDSRLDKINIQNYDGIFMGGDILSEASLATKYLDNLNALVDLSDPMTMWALGNHDSRNGNWDWISAYTQRKTYFSHYADKSVFMVLNTNIVPYDCEPLEEQFNMIRSVCDSISEAQNLFLFMHHNIWDQVPGLSPGWAIGHHNCKYWLANCDSVSAHFYNVVYPLLVEVKLRGIEVYCVFGDLGVTGKETFNEVSTHGIHFLGSGLYHHSPEDKILLFDNQNGHIDFHWHRLDSLVQSHQ